MARSTVAAKGTDVATDPSDADWERLRVTAIEAMQRAYAPYSGFPVGVAGLADDGRLLSGCNVENASFAVGLCAECGLVSELVRTGGGRLVAVWCVDAHGQTLMPCGRCRQLLWEHGGPQCRIQTPLGERTLADILPQAFSAEDLTKGAP